MYKTLDYLIAKKISIIDKFRMCRRPNISRWSHPSLPVRYIQVSFEHTLSIYNRSCHHEYKTFSLKISAIVKLPSDENIA